MVWTWDLLLWLLVCGYPTYLYCKWRTLGEIWDRTWFYSVHLQHVGNCVAVSQGRLLKGREAGKQQAIGGADHLLVDLWCLGRSTHSEEGLWGIATALRFLEIQLGWIIVIQYDLIDSNGNWRCLFFGLVMRLKGFLWEEIKMHRNQGNQDLWHFCWNMSVFYIWHIICIWYDSAWSSRLGEEKQDYLPGMPSAWDLPRMLQQWWVVAELKGTCSAWDTPMASPNPKVNGFLLGFPTIGSTSTMSFG